MDRGAWQVTVFGSAESDTTEHRTQIIHKKQANKKVKKIVLQYNTLKSTVVQYNSWHMGADTERTGEKSYRREKAGQEGDGGAQGSSAVGDGGQFHSCLMLTQVLIPCWIQFYLPS